MTPDQLAAALDERVQVLLIIALASFVTAFLIARLPVRCQHKWDCPQCAEDKRRDKQRSDDYAHKTMHSPRWPDPGCYRCREDKEREP